MAEVNLEEFSVGDVISKSFKTLFRNFIPFTLIGLLLLVPLAIIALVLTGTGNINSVYTSGAGWAVIIGFLFFYIIITYMIYAAITYGAVLDLQGKPAKFGKILVRGFATMFPVIGVALVSGFAIMLGMILFLIPGIVIAIILYIAVPVAVLERPGVFESLSRSADLTKGLRWKVFGIAIVAFIINFIVSYAGEVLFVGLGQIGDILNLILLGFTLAFGAVVVAVTYQELRRVKEGVDIDTIAKVFS